LLRRADVGSRLSRRGRVILLDSAIFGNLHSELGVLVSMRKRVFICGVCLCVLSVSGLLLLRPWRQFELGAAALALKAVVPPTSWADDCGRLRHAVVAIDRLRAENRAPLSADDIAIYRVVLLKWQREDATPLHLSDRTTPLDIASRAGVSDCECLVGFDVQGLVDASRSFQKLTPAFLPNNNFRLVGAEKQIRTVRSNDPGNRMRTGKSVTKAVDDALATGLFSISEIAYDKHHQRALVAYSFVCGSLCGSGGTWLFEKVNDTWTKTAHLCGGWVS